MLHDTKHMQKIWNEKDHNKQIFAITDKKWYYEFSNLDAWDYSISIIPHENWTVTQPTTAKRIINLANWQKLQNQNFGNFKIKWSKK